MRNNGQNKRMRGRNRKSHNPLGRLYESNGPDVKIRGTASHVAEKYLQLARDSQASGDPISAENYYQHAEHYFRLIAAAQEQLRQSQPYLREGGEREENYEEAEAQGEPSHGAREPHAPREPSFQSSSAREGREGQPFGLREPQPFPAPRQAGATPSEEGGSLDRLPAFITGGQEHAPAQNGYDGQERFNRRRRRHRPRGEQSHGHRSGEATEDSPPPAPSSD